MLYRLKFHILFLAVISFAAFGCARQEQTKEQDSGAIPVKVFKVELKDLSKILEYAGNIKAQDEVIVYPKVSGKIIQKVKEEGAAVEKGEVIAYIDRDEVGLKFEKAPVETPLSGVIGRVYVDIGANVSPQTSIALVADMDKVKINLDIPEKYLPKVYLGQVAQISVDAYPQDEFIGKVTKVSPIVNLENRAAPIEITVDNQGHKLKSGMFAKVKLAIEQHKDIPVILKEAVMGKESDNYVYVIENKKAILKKITLGLRQDEFYEVMGGLRQGDEVVIVGQQRLYEKAPVSVEKNGDLK